MSWLQRLIRSAAVDLERLGKAIFGLTRSVDRIFDENPIQAWEADGWARGLKLGLLRLEGYFFRAGSGKRSSLSFFVRNDQGLYVGLRRESITQAATYVSLVTDYGYHRTQTRFESQWMDVAVYSHEGTALIYAENKARQKTLEKLCARLCADFQSDIPPIADAKIVEDALMKAHHIWKNKPRYFWAVCSVEFKSYEVCYTKKGFTLVDLNKIPSIDEWESVLSSRLQCHDLNAGRFGW